MDIRTAIYRYCNYQPRCHKEVRNKLYELGAASEEVEIIISELIEKHLLNEEAYARAIARGKFRMKQWGKRKILQQLRLNKISEYCIKKGLSEIDPDEYGKTLQKLAAGKWETLQGEKNLMARKMKVSRYLIQKGYENDLVQDAVNEIAVVKNDAADKRDMWKKK